MLSPIRDEPVSNAIGAAPPAETVRGPAIAELARYWPTLVGATLGVAFGAAALPFYTSGLFIVELQAEFGWTRTNITAVSLAVTLMLGCLAPLAGALFDRVGIRGPAAVGFVALAAGFFALSKLSGSMAQYVLIQVCLSLFAIGTGPIAFTRPINMVFDRLRGLALGITIGGIGAMASLAPPIVAEIIATQGWRAAYQMLALAVICVAPVSLLLVSWRGQTAAAHLDHTSLALDVSPPNRWLFWRLMAGFGLVSMAVAGFVTHFVPMLIDQGTTPVAAARTAGLLGVAVLVGRVAVGALLDRVFAPWVAGGILIMSASGLALLALGGVTYSIAGALAVGLAIGAEVDLIAYLTARYYGMRRYGRMYGLIYGAFLIGTAISPFLISVIQRAGNSYTPALWLSAGLLVAAAGLFFTAPPFQPSAST